MANLNFQQPPRSIANPSLTGRTTGGFGGSSLSGHVTPTSGMFPTANYGQTQQPQLSPNRNAQLSVGGPALSSGGRTNLFGARPFMERRPVQGLGGGGPIAQMGNFMQSTAARSGYGGSLGGGGGSLNNFHNVFGGNGDVSSTPALLDPSEFPSLTNARGQNDQSLPQTNPLQPPGSKPYGNFFTSFGMVKQPTSEQSEFTMSNEDFPALPGTQNSDGTPGLPTENSLVVTDGTDKGMNSMVVGSGVGGAVSSAAGGSGGGIGVGVGGIMGAVGTGVSNMVVTSVASGGVPGVAGGGLSPGSMNINVNAATGGVGGLGVSGGGIGGLGASASSASSSAASSASSSGLTNNSSSSSGIGSSIMGVANSSAVSNTSLVSSSSAVSSSAAAPASASSSAGVPSAVATAPALGGSPSGCNLNSATPGMPGGGSLMASGGGGGVGVGTMCALNSNGIEHASDNSSSDKLMKAGVQTSPDGKVTNIPASMVNNQFGMVGLLTFIRAAESDPNLVTLALGTDLTGLGLNLNSQGDLHPTFAGPFADQPCRAQDVEYNVPPEYLINSSIRDKLSSPVMKKLQDDLLFFLFYTNIGDIMQLMAAAELHNREWRYHIEEKIWITRVPGVNQYEKNGTKERGTFYYFDAQSWKRLSKVLQIDPEKLDKCPNINAFMNINGQSV